MDRLELLVYIIILIVQIGITYFTAEKEKNDIYSSYMDISPLDILIENGTGNNY